MKSHTKLITLILVGVLSAGIFAGCQKGIFKHTPEKKAQWIVEEVSEELDLTELQVAKLVSIKDHVLQLRKTYKPVHESTHNDLLALMSEPRLDQDQVLAMINQKTQTLEAESPKVVALLADFYDALTIEQQKTLREAAQSHIKIHKYRH